MLAGAVGHGIVDMVGIEVVVLGIAAEILGEVLTDLVAELVKPLFYRRKLLLTHWLRITCYARTSSSIFRKSAISLWHGRARRQRVPLARVLRPVLRTVSVAVDVQAISLDIVAIVTLGSMVVPDDLMPLLPVSVLKLHDEPWDRPVVRTVTELTVGRRRNRYLVFTVSP